MAQRGFSYRPLAWTMTTGLEKGPPKAREGVRSPTSTFPGHQSPMPTLVGIPEPTGVISGAGGAVSLHPGPLPDLAYLNAKNKHLCVYGCGICVTLCIHIFKGK